MQWKIYFGIGRLVWADGGCHPYRSWQRHLSQYFPQIELKESDIIQAEKFECWNYYILSMLLQRQTITREQLTALIESKINEVLFDIWQQDAPESLEYSYQSASGEFLLASGLKMSLAFVNVEVALEQAHKAWLTWCQKGFQYWSPNLAPMLQQHEQLQQEVSASIYQNFVKLINGKRSLRDLAVYMNREVLQLTCSLNTYVYKGYIQLREIPDLPNKIFQSNCSPRSEVSLKSTAKTKPLIACIDDSPQVCKVMEQILKQAGYRFVSIADSFQAVPTLIASNPDLIFLDIGMPIVNGYELCSQLRRVSNLKDIPIVILTGNDGIVDRMRAKISGASDFISKPVDISKILSKVEKFLSSDNKDSKISEYSQSEQSERIISLVLPAPIKL